MSEVLTEIGGVKVTVKLAAGGFSLLVLALFALLWLLDRKKRAGGNAPFGAWMNAAGFGLLPAAAVWKAFEHHTAAGAGSEVTEPLPLIRWLTVGGKYAPCRIELAAALLCFGAVCLWLIIRKDDLQDQGDLLLTTLCLWAGILVVTEGFRPEINKLIRYAGCGMILLCMIWWTVRRHRIRPAPGRAVAGLGAAAACIGRIAVTTEDILSVGSAIGDLAVITGCAVLMVLLALLCGNDSRAVLSG